MIFCLFLSLFCWLFKFFSNPEFARVQSGAGKHYSISSRNISWIAFLNISWTKYLLDSLPTYSCPKGRHDVSLSPCRIFHITPKRYQFEFFSCSLTRNAHHTVWRTWLFIVAYSDEKWWYYQFLTTSRIHFFLYICFNFELGSERV